MNKSEGTPGTAQGWPDASRPGVPLHPERDGWHWVGGDKQPIGWDADNQEWLSSVGGWHKPAALAHYTYLSPVLTPAEHAAQVARNAALEKENAHAWDRVERGDARCVTYEADLDALRAQLTAAEMRSADQPIESAPRDGTLIDLWINGCRHTDCRWGKPEHCCGEAGRYCDSDWHGEPEGWVDTTFNFVLDTSPTHWRPLPAPPSPPQEQKP